MDDSFLKSSMSYTEFEDYHPIIDELVFYMTQWHENANKMEATND